MAKEYKKRDPKFMVFIRHDRPNTEELKNVGSRATLNGARKLAVAKLKTKLDKGIYDYTADITSIKTGQDVGTVAYHPKKGAFFVTGKVTNLRNGSVPTAFPIAPDGSLLRPVGSTTYKKLAKEPAVRARKKKGKKMAPYGTSYGAREQDIVEDWDEVIEE